ncbi:MAG: methyltransferase [bacterium]|nr:methyltransferase [bacterium]
MAPKTAPNAYDKIYAVVRKIPHGRVATYGQVARLAGLGRAARQVGYALHALVDESLPWQRVINSKGEISLRALEGPEEAQRRLLEDEGIDFDLRGRVDLSRYQWRKGRN